MGSTERSVLIAGKDGKLGKDSRDNLRGQSLEGKSLSSPSWTMFKTLWRICPKHPRHKTSVRELRESKYKSAIDQERQSHLKSWNSHADDGLPSKIPILGDVHRTARKIYEKG